MKSKLVVTMGKAMAASALVVGVMGVISTQAAHASTSAFYVAPVVEGGSDAGNNCTLASAPCASIQHALAEEVIVAGPDSVGSVINLAAGNYGSVEGAVTNDGFNTINSDNSNVTITGAGKKTVFEPTSCTSLSVDDTAPTPYQALVTLGTDGVDPVNGVTIENMVLNGAGVAGCAGYGAPSPFGAGVHITDATVGNAIVGVTVQSAAFYGILSDEGANSTIISNNLAPVLCTGKVTGPNTGLNAGWTSPANLKVNKIPSCAQFVQSSHGAATGVFINGVAYCMHVSATGKTIVLTGLAAGGGCVPIASSQGKQVAKGATVVFNTSAAPFTQFGIACNTIVDPEAVSSPATDCAVSDNTVTAGGTVLSDYPTCGGAPPVGILATAGGTLDADGNTVSGVTDSVANCPENGETTNDGIGIGLIPNAAGSPAGDSQVGVNEANSPPTGNGNKLSGNDVGILVNGGAPTSSFGAPAHGPVYEVSGNTVSSASQAGIALNSLGFSAGVGLGGGTLGHFWANSVGGVLTGAGIALEGTQNQTIGGPLAANGNTSNGNGVGLAITPCYGSPLWLQGSSAITTGALEANPNGNALCAGEAVFQGNPVGTGTASIGNTVQNNTLNTNVLYGLLKVGPYQPEEIAGPSCVFLSGGNDYQVPPTVSVATGNADCGDAGVTNLASNANTFKSNTWTGNGTIPSEGAGANVMDGTGWGGGCGSVSADCVSAEPDSQLTYEGANASFPATSNTTPFTLTVCNPGTVSVPLKVGSQLTFYDENTGLSGTFFNTSTTILQPNGQGGTCNTGTYPYTDLKVQAMIPAKVGTDNSPSGQSYILGTGAGITVNVNGAAVASTNTFGTGASANSCTPDGVNSVPNIFGTTNGVGHPSSSTLDAGTGGVNATYIAC